MVALVIGINAYGYTNALGNAVNDAKAVKKVLEAKDVKVFDIYDCNIVELKEKMNEFVGFLQKGDAAIVYFAGHGVEYNNALRLMATWESGEPDYMKDSLNVLVLLDRLATSYCGCSVLTSFMLRCIDDRIAAKQTSLNVFIFDCCRKFVYTSSESAKKVVHTSSESAEEDRGRSLVEHANQTVIAHACQPNSTASDGKGVHGGNAIP